MDGVAVGGEALAWGDKRVEGAGGRGRSDRGRRRTEGVSRSHHDGVSRLCGARPASFISCAARCSSPQERLSTRNCLRPRDGAGVPWLPSYEGQVVRIVSYAGHRAHDAARSKIDHIYVTGLLGERLHRCPPADHRVAAIGSDRRALRAGRAVHPPWPAECARLRRRDRRPAPGRGSRSTRYRRVHSGRSPPSHPE